MVLTVLWDSWNGWVVSASFSIPGDVHAKELPEGFIVGTASVQCALLGPWECSGTILGCPAQAEALVCTAGLRPWSFLDEEGTAWERGAASTDSHPTGVFCFMSCIWQYIYILKISEEIWHLTDRYSVNICLVKPSIDMLNPWRSFYLGRLRKLSTHIR